MFCNKISGFLITHDELFLTFENGNEISRKLIFPGMTPSLKSFCVTWPPKQLVHLVMTVSFSSERKRASDTNVFSNIEHTGRINVKNTWLVGRIAWFMTNMAYKG